jgi:hypothetical protein
MAMFPFTFNEHLPAVFAKIMPGGEIEEDFGLISSPSCVHLKVNK